MRARREVLDTLPTHFTVTEELERMIHAAAQQGITFIYTISPGLDICYSDEEEVACLTRKMGQLSEMGCQGYDFLQYPPVFFNNPLSRFALLFDDIPEGLCEKDAGVFSSFADAQVGATGVRGSLDL